MQRFHLDGPCESDAVKHLQATRTSDGSYLVVLSSEGRQNVAKLRSREPRHIWRAVTVHGVRWVEYRGSVGWTITKEEPK
jgi:hypothetical protein